MKKELGIWSYLKKDKINSLGECPIYLRVYYQKKRFEKSTGLKSTIINWCTIRQASLIDDTINFEIFKQKKEIDQYLTHLKLENQYLSPTEFRNAVINRNKPLLLIKYVSDYVIKMKKSGRYNMGTIGVYSSMSNHLKNYLESEGLSDLSITELKSTIIYRFRDYLLSNTKNSNNGAICIILNLKTVINSAIDLGFIKTSPFSNVRLKKTPFERGYLTNQEIETLENIDLSAKLDRVRDMFVFSCYTGLSFIDVSLLRKHHIVNDKNGDSWIRTRRKKTGVECNIPLLKKPNAILEKHKNIDINRAFKKISNQKTNQYLKDIAKISGIQKNLTFHLARHTFATTITLNNDVPIETVSKLLGHRKITTTQIYARVLDSKLNSDLRKIDL
ncbi:MAG: hypothetical protein CBC71_05300 [Rhodobacteraceae bacterium TMED111]|nr:MAG: hypothetical protein CBC71_05300 [Rhodobacteraceae bacterium TMED111]|tara:strand:+ start:256 stop:1419 length:1164 start_codon:yes stop_codon:yes gene_type:complete